MKKRYLYILLFAAPAFLAAIIVATLLFGAVAGFLWLFALGDNPWPSSVDITLTVGFILVFVALWAALLVAAYLFGKKQEAQAAPHPGHVLAAVGATVLLVLLTVAHQWRVGNLGPQSDGELCADFCRDQGFAGSGMPPRDAGAATCSCFDAQGREAVQVPMEEITARQDK